MTENKNHPIKSQELEAIANYLITKPYAEVAPIIELLKQIAQRAPANCNCQPRVATAEEIA